MGDIGQCDVMRSNHGYGHKGSFYPAMIFTLKKKASSKKRRKSNTRKATKKSKKLDDEEWLQQGSESVLNCRNVGLP